MALANLACAEDAADRVDRAQKLWRRAIRRMDPGSLRHLLARANLANSAALAGRFSHAAQEHREIARTARELGFDNLALHAELNLAETEFAVGRVEAAFAGWHRVIDASRIEGDLGMELVAEIDLATAETEVGELDLAKARSSGRCPGSVRRDCSTTRRERSVFSRSSTPLRADSIAGARRSTSSAVRKCRSNAIF